MLRGYLKPGGSIWISVPNESTSLAHNVPTYQVMTFLKLFALKLVPRRLKANWRKQHPSQYERSPAQAFRPLYFNYSLNDHSPHLQKFTFRSIQSTIREAGYEVARIDGGSMFYKLWPLHALMDRCVFLSRIDQRLAQKAKSLAGDLWVVARDPSPVS